MIRTERDLESVLARLEQVAVSAEAERQWERHLTAVEADLREGPVSEVSRLLDVAGDLRLMRRLLDLDEERACRPPHARRRLPQ